MPLSFLEPGRPWLMPQPRNKWGREFDTYSHQDPYHYPLPLLKDLAWQAGFRLDLVDDYGHPTQTMGRFPVECSAGSVDMSFGLLATLRDELLSPISFNHLIRVILSQN